MAGSLFRLKSIDSLLSVANQKGETALKRTLTAPALVALGIGGIIGAGLFVRTAAAIAERSGPSVVIAFLVAGVGCAFAGLCYAEFASMIPIAGSAYTYSYATMGELIAWIIGWDLVLEYALGAATVAIAWSEYFNKILSFIGIQIPYQWYHSPLEVSTGGVHGIMNIPAVFPRCAFGPSSGASRNRPPSTSSRSQGQHRDWVGSAGATSTRLTTRRSSPRRRPTSTTGSYPTPMAGSWAFWGPLAWSSLPSSGSMRCPPPRRRRRTWRDHADRHSGLAGRLHAALRGLSYKLSGVATVQDFRTAGKEASVAYAILTYMHGAEVAREVRHRSHPVRSFRR